MSLPAAHVADARPILGVTRWVAPLLLLAVSTAAHGTEALDAHRERWTRPALAPLLGWVRKTISSQRNPSALPLKRISGTELAKRPGGLRRLVALEKRVFPKGPWSKARLARFLDEMTVLVHGERIAGYVLVVDPHQGYEPIWGPAIERNEDKDEAYAPHLGVAPELKGCGVGTHLVSEAKRAARKMGKKRLYLHLRESNKKALRFYYARGFEVRGEVLPEVYPNRIKLILEDGIEMVRSSSRLPTKREVKEALRRLLGLPADPDTILESSAPRPRYSELARM